MMRESDFIFNSNTARVLIHVSNWNQSRSSSCLLLLSPKQCRDGWHMNKTGNLIRLLIEHISYFCPSFPPILHRPLDLTRQQRHLHLTDKQAIDFFVWGLSPTHFPPLIKWTSALLMLLYGTVGASAVRLPRSCRASPQLFLVIIVTVILLESFRSSL